MNYAEITSLNHVMLKVNAVEKKPTVNQTIFVERQFKFVMNCCTANESDLYSGCARFKSRPSINYTDKFIAVVLPSSRYLT